MFAYNIKDKLLAVAVFIILDIITYPWLNAMMMNSLNEYINTGFVQPDIVIMNWNSVITNTYSSQLFIIIHLLGVVLFVIYNPYNKVSFNLKYDKDGKPIALKTGEHGTARLATYQELKQQNSTYKPTKDTDPKNKYPLSKSGLVLSSKYINRKKDIEVVYMDKDIHSIILGATGSGKTESFIKPTILTLSDAGESMIIHDPKGELKKEYSGYLRDVKGYDVIEMNYADPRFGDQFNQLENVKRKLQIAQMHNIKWHTTTVITKYLEFILSQGESMGRSKENLNFIKMNLKAKQGNAALYYLRNFFAESYGRAWKGLDNNFYTFYRREKIIEFAMEILHPYTTEDISNYINTLVKQKIQYIESLTSQSSDTKTSAEREIRYLNTVLQELSNQDEVSISMYIKYFNLLGKEHKVEYKTNEADANIYARSIASMLVDGTTDSNRKGEKIWEDTPKAMLTSIIMFICRETHLKTSAHMGSVFQFVSDLSDPAKKSGQSSQTKMDVLFDNFAPEDPCRLSQTSVRIAGDKTKSSIMVSAVAPMEIFSSGSVIEQSCRTSFDLLTVAQKPTAIFILSAGRDENPIFSVLTSLFVEQSYISLVEFTRTQEELRLPLRVNYLLDELANMAKIPEYGSKVSLSRSRNIRFSAVLQSFAQLDINYKDDKNTILENTSWFYLLTNDYDTAKHISDRIGSYTADAESQSLNANSADNITSSASKQKMARPLYTPDEIMRFKKGEGLAIVSSDYPAKVDLLPAFNFPQHELIIEKQLLTAPQKRPAPEINKFVPEVNTFVDAYNKFLKDALFDAMWFDATTLKNTTPEDVIQPERENDNISRGKANRENRESTEKPQTQVKPKNDKKPNSKKKAKEVKAFPPKVTDSSAPEHKMIMQTQKAVIFNHPMSFDDENTIKTEDITEMLHEGVSTAHNIEMETLETTEKFKEELDKKIKPQDFTIDRKDQNIEKVETK